MSVSADTYEPPEPNEWPRSWARAVLATLIGMGFLGWAFAPGAGFWLKAGMCVVTVVIEGWGFIAAIQWSRALKREHVVGPLLYWAAAIVGCAAWTIFSIYHALGLILHEASEPDMGALATPAYVAFTYLALSLPFHEWAIERVETAQKKRPKLTGSPEIEPGPRAKGSRAHLRSIAGGLTGSVALAVSPGSQAHEPSSFPTEPVARPMQTSQKMSPAQVRNLDDASRATARLMLRQGQGPAEVHRATGVPLSTLKRWAKEAA